METFFQHLGFVAFLAGIVGSVVYLIWLTSTHLDLMRRVERLEEKVRR
jgi:hypothetical protein